MVDTENGAFVDTAAIMLNLDLVITSDSAIAHLAGALGVPVWLLLAKSPDFRWGLQGASTPWYPTMRIFRQSERGRWDDVMEQVAAALQGSLMDSAEARTPTIAEEIEAQAAHEEASRQLQRGELLVASDLLRSALQVCPSSAALHLDLGVVLARQKDFESAIQHLQIAIALAPDDPIGYRNLNLAMDEKSKAELHDVEHLPK